MITVYGKGKVGNSMYKLLQKFEIASNIMDDSDYNEDILSKSIKIIVSPGISPKNQIYQKFSDKIIGEIDFVYDLLQENGLLQNFEFIGITGTDGKSTTSRLVYNMLDILYKNGIFKGVGIDGMVWLCGNFDIPVSQIVFDIFEKGLFDKKHILVIEVSSFMAYNIKNSKFDFSIWTNFQKDHLNWHPDMAHYFNSKLNLIKNTKIACIINPSIKIENQVCDIITFSTTNSYDCNFVGKHNMQNIDACMKLIDQYMKSKSVNLNFEYYLDILKNIMPLPHRIQFVKDINGIKIYDDGKSTTAQSLKAAITSFDEKIILIAGGSDKGDDFSVLKDDFQKHLYAGVFIGQTKNQFANVAMDAGVDYRFANDMSEAVDFALQLALKYQSKVILFSPGCASFDMFKNREDRVNRFLEKVNSL